MSRLIACLTALIVITCVVDASAQRRQPLRNLARKIGIGTSAGLHQQNPGPDTSEYNPWSSGNTPQHTYPKLNESSAFQLDPSIGTHSVLEQHSILEQHSDLFDPIDNPATWQIQPGISLPPTPDSSTSNWQPGPLQQTESTILNRLLKPYQSPNAQAPSNNRRSIFNGGQFIPPFGSQR